MRGRDLLRRILGPGVELHKVEEPVFCANWARGRRVSSLLAPQLRRPVTRRFDSVDHLAWTARQEGWSALFVREFYARGWEGFVVGPVVLRAAIETRVTQARCPACGSWT